MLLSPEIIINAYSQGYFPMAEGEDEIIYWHSPDPRAIIPLDKIKKIPRSLAKSSRKNEFSYSINTDFEFVIRACADRSETWISEEIILHYCELNKMGLAHSVETIMDNQIVGGLYGLSLGSAFFGESMFSAQSDAAKASYYYFLNYLKQRNFRLLDSQFINPFTEQLGAIEISKSEYQLRLAHALSQANIFDDTFLNY